MSCQVSTSSLLSAWERGLPQSPTRRALTLLAATYPGFGEDELFNLSIGERDGLLMDLREALFGSSMTCLAQCTQCAEQLEMAIDLADIRIKPTAKPVVPLTLELPDYRLDFRLPTSQDLLLIESQTDLAAARQLLLERCLLMIQRDDQMQALNDLPDEILNQVEAAMSDADSQADVQLALTCPACRNHWLSAFDIASFLWCEINAWAGRIINEVHLLAKAYGWRESDILALTPTRRRFYLTLISGAGV